MTKLSEAERTQLYTEIAAATSSRTAEILMHEMLDVRWDDVATKVDLAAAETSLRSDMNVGFARLDAKLERQLRLQLIWLMSGLLALGGLILGFR